MFQALTMDDLRRIVTIQLRRLERLLLDRRITLELTMDAKNLLAEHGFDPVYGARPLKRVVQRSLQDPLAMQILEGRIHEGDHVIVDISEDGEGLSFSAVPATETA
jgi:ATP-dependent Clp protease ATP-binding subunit ClpB